MTTLPRSAVAKIRSWAGILNVRVTILRETKEFYHIRYEQPGLRGTVGMVLPGELGRISKKNISFSL